MAAGQLRVTHCVSLQHLHLKALGWGIRAGGGGGRRRELPFDFQKSFPYPVPGKVKVLLLSGLGIRPRRTGEAQDGAGEGGEPWWVTEEQQRTGNRAELRVGRLH